MRKRKGFTPLEGLRLAGILAQIPAEFHENQQKMLK